MAAVSSKAQFVQYLSLALSDKFTRIERRQLNLPGLLSHRNLLHPRYTPGRPDQCCPIHWVSVHRMLVLRSSEQLLRASWNDLCVCELLFALGIGDSIHSNMGAMLDVSAASRRWNGCKGKHSANFRSRKLPCVHQRSTGNEL